MDTRYYSGTPLISIVYSWTMKIWLCLPDGHNQHFFLGRSLKCGAFFFLFVLPSSVRNGLQSEWKNILIVVSFISSKLKKVNYSGTQLKKVYYSGTPLISIVYSWTMKIWLCLPDGHNQHFFLGRSLKCGAFFFLFVLPSSVRNGLQSEWKNILIVVSFISSKLKKVTLVCQINIFSLSSYPESDLYLSMAWLNNFLWNWSVNWWRSRWCRRCRC